MMNQRQPVDVVVCVHNSPEYVGPCLASVLPTLAPGDRLVIVDDGSAPETQRICEEAQAAAPDRVLLIRRPQGSGFCRAANAGLRETTAGTVILLNSDTLVTGDWIDRIEACMTSNWQIGIVGPLSNAGGWQSIPELPNPANPGGNISDDPAVIEAVYAHCTSFRARFEYPFVDQINGFCFALSRAVIDRVGILDEERFPMGYGEENDLTFRAMDAGFLCAVAIDCFVHHAKTKSYTTELRERYNAAGQAMLRDLHGTTRVENAVKSTQRNPILAAIRKDARETFPEAGWLETESAG
ncbi:MAG: glycosyltransferase family 2 protein [Pseudomonadota bacterium]